jgi:DNA polymerase-1
MNSRPTLYILDAYSLIYQVFHAIPLMTSPSGQPTNAIFGIFRDLLNLLKTRKPDYLAAAFDGAGKT